jgi:hypothetical protein
VQTGTALDKRDEFVELANCGPTTASLDGCKLVYWDRYTYRNLSGNVTPHHSYLIANANGSMADQADDHFWISFSQDHTASVSIVCETGFLSRVSWYALGGYNFTLHEGELYEVTSEAVPARNSGVSVLDW